MEVLLDSSFIVSCFRRKIDFISALEEQGFKILIPREVLQELKDLKLKSVHEDRVAIGLALEMFEKSKVKKVRLGGGSVDEQLIKKGRDGIYVATLDSAI